MTEHEHSETLEERWRTNFSTQLGKVTRQVDQNASEVRTKLDVVYEALQLLRSTAWAPVGNGLLGTGEETAEE